ncbi:MAG: hypothetical protein LBK53_08225 [Heliobacteriaceae bacterium]|jgi:predicted outer membrane repeat protein|nr:hypothetical protein [Heliobacteriaceae bacterium]
MKKQTVRNILILLVYYLNVLAVSAVNLEVPGSYATIQSAINAAASGDSIVISSSYTGTGPTSAISKQLTFISADTSNPTIININKSNKFNFTSGSTNSTISYLGVTGGSGSAQAGAFNNNSGTTININNSTFSSNSITGSGGFRYGGAVYNLGSLNITDTVFNSNEATGVKGGFSYGGAIYNNGGTMVISRSAFNSNSATSDSGFGYGGAVYNTSGSSVTVDRTTFDSNMVKSSITYGGAIYNSGGSMLNINEGTVFSNSNNVINAGSGGAVYNSGSAIITGVLGDEVIFNGLKARDGGAIYNSGSDTVFTINGNTNFTNNTATSYGGAIYNSVGTIVLNSSDGNITFEGNSASRGKDIYNSGIIDINGTAGSVEMSGGIAGSGTVNKSGSGLLHLSADSNSSLFTGVLNETGGTVQVEGVMFAGQNNITGSILQVTSDMTSIYYNANLYDNAELDHISTNTNITTISPASSLTSAGINLLGTDAEVNFQSGLPDNARSIPEQTAYSLTAKLDNGNTNYVNFTNAKLTLGSTDYTGATQYSMSNTLLDLANSSVDYDNYEFSYLAVSNNTNLNFKVTNNGFRLNPLTADTLNIVNGSGTAGINRIYIYDSENNWLTGEVQVLDGPITFDSSIPAVQYSATTEYEYNVSKTADNQGVIFSVIGQADEGTLEYVNTLDLGQDGTRSFQINGGTIYQNTASLSEMAQGTFSVYGQIPLNRITTILSGDLTGGGNGSLFDIEGSDTVDFTLSDLTVQNAYLDGDGSVMRQYNPNSTVNLTNIAIENNNSTGNGGAISQTDGVLFISGDTSFFRNTADNGGAIDHQGGTLAIYDTTFSSNQASADGGAIYNTANGLTINGEAVFQDNTAGQYGGAIYNSAVMNLTSDNSGDITFSGNQDSTGSNDIYNNGGTVNINGETGVTSIGGGISGTGTINKSGNGILTLESGSDNSGFTGMFTQTTGTTNTDGIFFGGNNTISGGTLNWLANASKDADSTLQVLNGTLNVNGVLDLNNAGDSITGSAVVNILSAINVDGGAMTLGGDDSWDGTVTLNSGSVTIDGLTNSPNSTYSQTGGTLTAQNTSVLNLGSNSSITGGDISVLSDSVVNAGAGVSLNGLTNLTLDSGTINSINGVIDTNTIQNLLVGTGGANFAIDIDGRDATSDSYLFDNITELGSTGTVNVSGFNFTSRAPVNSNFEVQVFDGAISSSINFTASGSEAESPVGYYKMSSLGSGLYGFSLTSFNKQVYRGQAATLSAYFNQLLINNVLFDHIYLDSNEIASGQNKNRYAAAFPQFAPYQFTKDNGGLWFKTYAAFEKLSFTQDLNVGNNAYGSLVGADFDVVKLKNGWKFLPTAYIGYNGGHQTFNGVGMYQNGGQGGFMGTFSKGGFIGSILAYGGGYNNEMSVESATDRTANWFAGTALKSAYNFHPSRRFIIQPTVLVSYNIFGKQNWGSDFGAISMNSGFLNGINVAPGLNLIYGHETWSLYLTAQYMYNINDKLNGSAGNINLPDIRMRHGYIEYGIGAVKNFKERFSSYVQIVIRNGGRTGVSFQAGLTWKF